MIIPFERFSDLVDKEGKLTLRATSFLEELVKDININTAIGSIFTQTADNVISNTVLESSLLGTGVGSLVLPANFWVIGKTVSISIYGDFVDTGLPTAEVRAKLGTVTISDSAPISLKGLSGVEKWQCDILITCRSIGVTGTVQTAVTWEYETTTGSSAIERLDIAGTLTAIDTTISSTLDVTYQWGTASASNVINSQISVVRVLN